MRKKTKKVRSKKQHGQFLMEADEIASEKSVALWATSFVFLFAHGFFFGLPTF